MDKIVEIFEFIVVLVVALVTSILLGIVLLTGALFKLFGTINNVVLFVGAGLTIIGDEWIIAWGGKIGVCGKMGTILPFAKINVPGPNAFKEVFDLFVIFVFVDFTLGVTNGVEKIAVLVTTTNKKNYLNILVYSKKVPVVVDNETALLGKPFII